MTQDLLSEKGPFDIIALPRNSDELQPLNKYLIEHILRAFPVGNDALLFKLRRGPGVVHVQRLSREAFGNYARVSRLRQVSLAASCSNSGGTSAVSKADSSGRIPRYPRMPQKFEL